MLDDRCTRRLVSLNLQRIFKRDQVVGLSIQDSQELELAAETSLPEVASQVEALIRTVEQTLVPHLVLVVLGECEEIKETWDSQIRTAHI